MDKGCIPLKDKGCISSLDNDTLMYNFYKGVTNLNKYKDIWGICQKEGPVGHYLIKKHGEKITGSRFLHSVPTFFVHSHRCFYVTFVLKNKLFSSVHENLPPGISPSSTLLFAIAQSAWEPSHLFWVEERLGNH